MIIGKNNRIFHMRSLTSLAIKFALCCIAIFMSFSHAAYAETQDRILQARDAQSSEAFSKHIDFYQDPSGTLMIEDILQTLSQKFEPIKTTTPQFGFTKNTIWLRAHVQNKTFNAQMVI